MCKGKKRNGIILFLSLHLDTLKLCVFLAECCQPESFACWEGFYGTSRTQTELGAAGLIFVREAVGDCVNLLFTCLSQPEVLIAVSGSREPSSMIIPAWFVGCVSSGHRGPAEEQGLCPSPVTCLGCWPAADIEGTAASNQLKGFISWETFSGNPQFQGFLSRNLPQDYDELMMNWTPGVFITPWKYSFSGFPHC